MHGGLERFPFCLALIFNEGLIYQGVELGNADVAEGRSRGGRRPSHQSYWQVSQAGAGAASS
jgi:hypothetical protein